MASGSLLTLLDDIATILDDVSVMTKTAASKTAGVLGDDLALNAEQVTGVVAKREIPVVWAVAKGSFLNKLILVPAALLISAFAPFLVTPLLMVGGLYLSFEGAEKILHLIHKRAHPTKEEAAKKLKMLEAGSVEEMAKIKGAIRTDFILSAEIIAITLGVVAAEPFLTQLLTLSTIAIGITVSVYGLVAGIVKLDDLGLYLAKKTSSLAQKTGRAILWTAPYLMKFLSIAGTVAMFLVGGGIIAHGIPWLHHQIEHLAHGAGSVGAFIIPSLLNGLVGLAVGFVAVGIYKMFAKSKAH